MMQGRIGNRSHPIP